MMKRIDETAGIACSLSVLVFEMLIGVFVAWIIFVPLFFSAVRVMDTIAKVLR